MLKYYYDSVVRALFRDTQNSFEKKEITEQNFFDYSPKEARIFFELDPAKAKGCEGLVGLRTFSYGDSGLRAIFYIWKLSLLEYEEAVISGEIDDFFEKAIMKIDGGFNEKKGKEELVVCYPQEIAVDQYFEILVRISHLLNRKRKRKNFKGKRRYSGEKK